MKETIMDETQLARLADAGHALRPDWPVKSLRSFLGKHFADKAYRDVALVLANVATIEPRSDTPKLMLEAPPWAITALASGQSAADRHPSATTWDELCAHCGSGRPVCQSSRMQQQDPHPYKTRWDLAIDRRRADQREAHAAELPEWTPDGNNPGRIPAVHRQTMDAGLAEGREQWQRRLAATNEEASA